MKLKMNREQKTRRKNELLQLIQPDCRHGNKDGFVNVVKRNSVEHEMGKTAVTHWLLNNGFSVFSEAVFVNKGGKGDIVAVSDNGVGYIVEILCSESDERYALKEDKYPEEFTMVKVRMKDFDYKTFCL